MADDDESLSAFIICTTNESTLRVYVWTCVFKLWAKLSRANALNERNNINIVKYQNKNPTISRTGICSQCAHMLYRVGLFGCCCFCLHWIWFKAKAPWQLPQQIHWSIQSDDSSPEFYRIDTSDTTASAIAAVSAADSVAIVGFCTYIFSIIFR